jgi:hypothetical protein
VLGRLDEMRLTSRGAMETIRCDGGEIAVRELARPPGWSCRLLVSEDGTRHFLEYLVSVGPYRIDVSVVHALSADQVGAYGAGTLQLGELARELAEADQRSGRFERRDSGTFETPEAAALDGFPAAHCRVVAALADGDDAYVVLDAGPAGRPYPYGVSASRRAGGWLPGASGNGPGWTLTDRERELGTATVWGEAPDGADRVRAALDDDLREAPVAGGVYLVAWWRVPGPAGTGPRVEAFRIRGRWVPEPPVH